MKIYLDVCCLNRPFDDQTQTRIHLEAEAVISIIQYVEDNEWEWISSDAVAYEISRTPTFAQSANADIFLSTDDKLIKRVQCYKEVIKIALANPLSWLQEVII